MQVEVFIPQVDGQPPHMVQEDINEQNLMGGDLNQDLHQENGNNNMQLGIVEFLEPSEDPIFAEMIASKQQGLF